LTATSTRARWQRVLPDLEIRDHTAREDVASQVAGRDVVLVNKLGITREIIETSPSLRLVALAATGHEQRGSRGSR